MKSSRFRFLALAVSALLLSACRIVVETRVNADGSGERRTAVVYSVEEMEAFAQSPSNQGKSICDDVNANLPAGAKVVFVEEARGDETQCVSTQPFADLGELRLAYALMENVTVNRLEFSLGRFFFDVDVAQPETGPNGQPPIPTEWRLTVPGTLGSHNAHRVEGQTLIWELAPGQKTNLHAESAVGPGVATLGAVGLACVGGLVVGGAGMYLLLRRRRGLKP